jgi:AcrR family transcriptional regulator
LTNIAYWSNGQYNKRMKNVMDEKKRKAPAERRNEIVAAAARLVVARGLESLTLRRVAEALGVVPGLVNHYFPAVDDLAAAAFGYAAAAEREGIFAALDPALTPLGQMRMVLAALLADETDEISLLWLDAWQATRTRPALRVEVAAQMRGWQEAMSGLIARGAAAGDFAVADAQRSATRLMALIDGMSIQAAMRSMITYDAVRALVVETVERELGLEAGSL